MIITFDTMVAIWCVRKRASVGQEFRLPVAQKLLQQIDADKERLILTAPVVSEYLCGFDDDAMAEELRVLRSRFFIHPFDVKAAAIAAKLTTNKELIKSIQQEFGISRQPVKADIAIIASAISGKASVLISDEPRVKKAAQGLIMVKTMDEFIRPSLGFPGL